MSLVAEGGAANAGDGADQVVKLRLFERVTCGYEPSHIVVQVAATQALINRLVEQQGVYSRELDLSRDCHGLESAMYRTRR